MTEGLEQRYCIKFCQKLDDSQVETIRKIQRVFGDDAMGTTQIKGWYNRFKDCRTSVDSDARSGRPSTSRNDELIDQVRTLVMQDHRVTVWELAEEVGINTGSVHSILTDDLSMRRVSAKSGNCIMTTHQLIPRNWFKLSWPNTTFLWFDRLPTLPTWFLAIFGRSPTWKRSWKELDLSHETTLDATRRPSCTPFAKRHFRNAWNYGGTAGRSMFSHKKTTSKGIRVADLQACKCIFPGQRSDTFWTALLHKSLTPSVKKDSFAKSFSFMKPEDLYPVYKVPPTNCTLNTFHTLTHSFFTSFQKPVQIWDPE